MPGTHSLLFARVVLRNREAYVLKVVTLAVAFASSVLVILFSANEFGFDHSFRESASVFRVVERNSSATHTGNRLSARIPSGIADTLINRAGDSLAFSRVKIMKGITVLAGGKAYPDQIIHGVDSTISDIFSFDFLQGGIQSFRSGELSVLLSERALKRFGLNSDATIKLFAFGDTLEARVVAVYHDFPANTHEVFEIFIPFQHHTIRALDFNPEETGLYGRKLNSSTTGQSYVALEKGDINYHYQPLPSIYLGPRVDGEEATHGDRYSLIILICIGCLIFFLALTSFVNLTTLTLPGRAREMAIKKLAGVSPLSLVLSFLLESFVITGLSLTLGVGLLTSAAYYLEGLLGAGVFSLLTHGNTTTIAVVISLWTILAFAPLFMIIRFSKASPQRLLGTEKITFPRLRATITVLQFGISIFLIVASLVISRQINYSLVKEPGRNFDQVVYLSSPSGITNDGIQRLRSNWKKFNPNIVDVMAVSQLPDRISSKEINSEFYSLQVDPGFREFFDFRMLSGNWFKANDGDTIFVTNRRGSALVKDSVNHIGVIQDFASPFNEPERPVRIKLAPDYQYNWLCVRVLEVDIRRTVERLANDFSAGDRKAGVHFMNQQFEAWLTYQDRINSLSGILALISAILSCCSIYGLSVSLVRDKLRQIAVHKLYGADTIHITRFLVSFFARQLLVALIIFAPVTYILLSELLRTFVYATKFEWWDPVYPIAYCAVVITGLCSLQALQLNRSDLSGALKG